MGTRHSKTRHLLRILSLPPLVIDQSPSFKQTTKISPQLYL
jgi:hypothetical protein